MSSGLDTIELTIDSLSYNGGRGVGRHEGVVVFVPGTAPNEVVRARVTLRKPRYWEAELLAVLHASPARRVPPCPVASRCGGCSWQHVEYAEQVAQKINILKASLRPLAKLCTWEWLPFLHATEELHYRNRIQIQVRGSKKGFFAKRSNDLVAIEECWIAEPSLNQKLKSLRCDPETQRVEIARVESGEVLVMPQARESEAALFAQVNTRQNEVLRAQIEARIQEAPDWILDLYCGSGNLTLPLANRFPSVGIVAVELSRAAVAHGRERGKQNIEWQVGDVGQILKGRTPRSGRGLVVLDPPRGGCAPEVMTQLLRHFPKQIVYVSCNPTTFARDAVKLVQGGHYRLESVQGLDMFPQTEHVELIALLCAAT